MFGNDLTYLDYELAYRAERLRGERPDQHHDGHRTLRAAFPWRSHRNEARRAA